MMSRSSESSADSLSRRVAYSSAASGSWMEQGPQMTSRRSSRPVMMPMASLRPLSAVRSECSVCSSSAPRARAIVLLRSYRRHLVLQKRRRDQRVVAQN